MRNAPRSLTERKRSECRTAPLHSDDCRPLRMASPITVRRMATLTIRTDPEVKEALESLTQDGSSRSEAARAAILMAGRRSGAGAYGPRPRNCAMTQRT